MAKRGNIARLKQILLLGGITFGLSALALLIVPRMFTNLLGLSGSIELDWAMRMIAVTLLALTGNMVVQSILGSDNSVLWAARVMQGAAFGLGVVTLYIPTAMNWFVILYALIGFGFSAAYTLYSLQKRKD
jgi:hypothetical protein